MNLLAQAEIPTGAPEWWSNWGIAGMLTLIGVSVAIYVLVQVRNWLWDYWNTRKPHLEEKLKAEAAKEQEAAKLFQTLRESEGTRTEILRALTGSESALQSTCVRTEQLIGPMVEKVEEIHARVVMGKMS